MPTCQGGSASRAPLEPPLGRETCVSRGWPFGNNFPLPMPTDSRKQYQARYRKSYRQRTRRVSVSLSLAEYARLERAAAQFSERATTHLKRRAFAHLDDAVLVPPELGERLQDLVFLIRNIATNVNQMARHSNEIQAVLDAKAPFHEVARLEAALRAMVERPVRQPSP